MESTELYWRCSYIAYVISFSSYIIITLCFISYSYVMISSITQMFDFIYTTPAL